MDLAKMEMHQIRYFLGVARTLNFTRAAEECHVSQPSLTRAVKLLEEELGGDLFRRERNTSHLTELGQRMLPLLQHCYDTAQGAKSLATSIKKGEVATLRLALSRTIDITILLPFLKELVRTMNGLELKFLRGTAAEIANLLKQGDADLAIAGPLGETWDRLDARPLFSEEFVLVVHAQHRLAAKTTIDIDDLLQERLLRHMYCEYRLPLTALLQNRLPALTHGHEVASERDLLSLLEGNIGVAFAPRSMSLPECLRPVQVDALDLSRTVYLYNVAGRPRGTPAGVFMKQLQAADWSRVLDS